MVALTVTNTGSRRSREVVQVYLDPAPADQPIRLVGWAGVTADHGESVAVEVKTDPRLWRRWNSERRVWEGLPAGGTLLLARGLGDIRGTIDVG